MDYTDEREVKSVGPIVGTCMLMCSECERIGRERDMLLHPLELESINLTDGIYRSPRKKSFVKSPNKALERADPNKVVKEYSRPAAGREDFDPSEIRPAFVLKQTMVYLLTAVASLDSKDWHEVYQFIFDRIRAVRQDMVVQAIQGQEAIEILEMAVRFHVYAFYRLRHCDVSDFDPKINNHHMLESLKELLCLYKTVEELSYDGHRPEFEAIYLLHNLGNEESLKHYLSLDDRIRNNSLVKKCFLASLSVLTGNYHAVFRLISALRLPLCLCAVAQPLHNIRLQYLQIMSHAYSAKNCQFPIRHLTCLLQLPTDRETYDLCMSCNLFDWFSTAEVSTHKSQEFVCFNKTLFKWPSKSLVCPDVIGLNEKLKLSLIPSLLVPGWRYGISQEETNENYHYNRRYEGEKIYDERMSIQRENSRRGETCSRSSLGEVLDGKIERNDKGNDTTSFNHSSDREKVVRASVPSTRGRGRKIREGIDSSVSMSGRGGRGRGRGRKKEGEEKFVSENLRMGDVIAKVDGNFLGDSNREGENKKLAFSRLDSDSEKCGGRIIGRKEGVQQNIEAGENSRKEESKYVHIKDRLKERVQNKEESKFVILKDKLTERKERVENDNKKDRDSENKDGDDWFCNYGSDGEKIDEEDSSCVLKSKDII